MKYWLLNSTRASYNAVSNNQCLLKILIFFIIDSFNCHLLTQLDNLTSIKRGSFVNLDFAFIQIPNSKSTSQIVRDIV